MCVLFTEMCAVKTLNRSAKADTVFTYTRNNIILFLPIFLERAKRTGLHNCFRQSRWAIYAYRFYSNMSSQFVNDRIVRCVTLRMVNLVYRLSLSLVSPSLAYPQFVIPLTHLFWSHFSVSIHFVLIASIFLRTCHVPLVRGNPYRPSMLSVKMK